MSPDLKPEEQARELIDRQLTQAGWYVCDRKDVDLVNHQGNAVREVIMGADHGRVDYLLYVDKRVVGVTGRSVVGFPANSGTASRSRVAQRLWMASARHLDTNAGKIALGDIGAESAYRQPAV